MKNVKAYYSNYERNHAKIKQALSDIRKEGGELSVKNVSIKANVPINTAYDHGCRQMIKLVLESNEEDVDFVLEAASDVTYDELQKWADKICKRYNLPKCNVTIYIEMDECVDVIGECDRGSMVFYESYNPKCFCISVFKEALKNRQLVYDTMQEHLWTYKKIMDGQLN